MYLDKYFSWRSEADLIKVFSGRKWGFEFAHVVRKWAVVLGAVGRLVLSEEKSLVLEKHFEKVQPVVRASSVKMDNTQNKEFLDKIVD